MLKSKASKSKEVDIIEVAMEKGSWKELQGEARQDKIWNAKYNSRIYKYNNSTNT